MKALDLIKDIPAHPDHIEGYIDGYDLDCPEPNENRSERYKHSFRIGRAEKKGPYSLTIESILASLVNAEKIEGEKE